MQFLIDFADGDEEFLGILGRASEYKCVQGVVLDIDRLWLSLWANSRRWADSDLNYYLRNLAEDRLYLVERWAREMSPQIFSRPLTLYDVEHWRPSFWDEIWHYRGRPVPRWPLVVKVCLRPQLTEEEPIPTALDLYDPSGRLVVEVETRPRARLASDPRLSYSPLLGGLSIGVGASDFGTLGLVLKDTAGTRYGLTCAHVVEGSTRVRQPARRDSRKGGYFGSVILSSTLTPCGTGSKCNPWSGVVANEIDAALIKIDPTQSSLQEILDIGVLSGSAGRASMTTSQSLEVMGRTSNLNTLQIGGLAVWYSFQHNGSDYCFKNLFEIESPYGKPGLIRPGDSGAPVCTAGNTGTEWAGLVAGQDSYKGYAVFAETIDSWLSNRGYSLTVL